MESKARYALIGAFVLVAAIGFLSFIAYFSGRQFDRDYAEYIVVFTDAPPRGISAGSEVRLSSVNVGEVTQTALKPNDPNTVFVHIRVFAGTPVYEDTYAQLEPLGLTGLSYIQLFAGRSRTPLVPPARRLMAEREKPLIDGRASQLDSLLEGSDSVIENVNSALRRASNVLDPDATDDLHEILLNIRTITGAVARSDLSNERVGRFMDSIEQAANDVSIAGMSVDKTAKDISQFLQKEKIDEILARAESVMVTTEQTLEEYQKLAQSATKATDETFFMLESLSASALQDLAAVMAELKSLSETLNRVGDKIERSPLEFVTGAQKEITELPQ